MNLHTASIGQLIIVNLFVFYIWFKVLVWAIINNPPNPEHTKLFITSLGLVIVSGVLVALMVFRIFEIFGYEIDIYILISYGVLSFGSLMFIVSASIGTNWTQFKIFLAISLVWNMVFVLSNLKGN